MGCLFVQSGSSCVCVYCKRSVPFKRPGRCHKYHANCKSPKPNPVYLGDRVEQLLTRLGITSQRIIALKKRIGMKPKCGCQWRKDWLNNLDRWCRRMLGLR